ncbi:MAG: RNA-binding protein [Flavobacteriaceae bacterium]|nr:MAG: RNA-binding protein [Flavobacteriaceae bacterium]
MKYSCLFILLIISFFSCKENSEKSGELNNEGSDSSEYLLSLLPNEATNVHFFNSVVETYEANYLNYEFIYNGSGVAVGDLNNDGLEEIYFGGNSTDDKLYLNEGNFKFKDISSVLGLENLKGWTTGINMVDINADGLLDIYVCRSGPSKINTERANKLFINKGDLEFVESARTFGLDKTTHSIQSAFFDHDRDGDLDMYLLNHPTPGFKPKKFTTHIEEVKSGKIQTDFFFENIDGNFVDKTREAGLTNFGYRHGIAVGDINQDHYPDIYISSDFDEPDFFYINNKDKTFTNVIDEQINHISMNSMGNEFADINNDGLLDICVVDMAPSNHFRSKAYMKSMNTTKFNALADNGFHYQYMQNTMHVNNGNGTFSEIAQLAGIATTDWSWAPLFFDIDLDGKKDLFISNGIKENFLYRDIQTEVNQKQVELNRNLQLEELLNIVPSDITQNDLFQNNGNFKFNDVKNEWITPKKFNSNGAAYADLDNDGDLDLVLNNMQAEASIYENTVSRENSNYLKIILEGESGNTRAIGAKVTLETNEGIQVQELHNARGYLSSVSYPLVFGTGKNESIIGVSVKWPDGKVSVMNNPEINQTISINPADARTLQAFDPDTLNQYFTEINPKDLGISYRHSENKFNDYSRQLLLPQKQSTLGPAQAVADVNGDGLEDIYIGGALGQSGELYLQQNNGKFRKVNMPSFLRDKNHEDQGALFFDADEDGDFDLYVTSGGYELQENDPLLQDRFYINNGQGNFTKSNRIPKMLSSTKAVKPIDFDKDGDLDLVIGGRVIPGKYPLAPNSYLLQNDQGTFQDVTDSIAPELRTIGMVSDMEISDNDNDGDDDILVVGPWMPITILTNNNSRFIKAEIPEFEKTEGWYYSVASADFDKDGDLDYVIGNIGMNNKFHPSTDKPLHIFSTDFDSNGSYDIALSKKYNGQLVPTRGKECSSEQTPFLNDKIATYKEFASLNIESIYGNDKIANSNHLVLYNFNSVYVENLGNNNFIIHELPIEAQIGPTLDFEIFDVNKDGYLDIVGVGNIYDAEVETVRYDASKGYVLLGSKNGTFTSSNNSGFNVNKDMRAISNVRIGEKPHLFVVSNNSELDFFQLK